MFKKKNSTKVIPFRDEDELETSEEEALIKRKVRRARKPNVISKMFRCCKNCCCGCFNYLITLIYRCYFFIIGVYCLYLLYIIPFRIAFLEEEYLGWTITEAFFDLLLLADIFVSMTTSYHRNYRRNTWPRCFRWCGIRPIRWCCFYCRQACCHYLLKNVLFDLVVFLPIYALTPLVNFVILELDPNSDFVLHSSWLKLNRMLLILRLPNFFSHLRDFVAKLSIIQVNPVISKVFLFLVMVFLIAHYVACFFYLVVRLEDSNEAIEFAMCNDILESSNVAFKYFNSLYWSVVTMTGYGGTLPITDVETVFSLIAVFIGVLVYVTVIGIVGSMITNLDTAATAYRDKVDSINDYMKFRKLESKTQKSIRKYYHYLWSTRKGMDEAKIMFSLPEFLRLEVSRCLNKDMLKNFIFFKESSEGFIRGILTRLIPKTVYPSSYIIKQGEIGREMYFLTKGTVDIYVKGLPRAVATLSAVCYFGEAALLTGNKRNASIIARDFCDMFVLKQKDFEEICSCYKEEEERIWGIHRERNRKNEEERREKEKREQVLQEEKERLEKEERRRRQKLEEKMRIERLKREKNEVFEKRKRRKRKKLRDKIRRQEQLSGPIVGSLRKRFEKFEILARTKEIM